jgi:hypothetical protein
LNEKVVEMNNGMESTNTELFTYKIKASNADEMET